MTAMDPFRRVVEHLDRVRIPYMFAGSVAGSFHGVPRATQDIDLVIAPTLEQIRELVGNLSNDEYYASLDAALDAQKGQSQFNVIDMKTGWKVDLILRKTRPFSITEFERRLSVDVHGLRLFVASPEDVVLSKLEWAKKGQSRRQVEDVAGLLRVRFADLNRAYIDHWVQALEILDEWNDACRLAGITS
jgi:hypothetical protein